MVRIGKHINIDMDVAEHIQTNSKIFNFSDWVNEAYRNEFMDRQKLEKKLQELNREIETTTHTLVELVKLENNLISETQRAWILEEGLEKIKHFTMEGVYKHFINKFDIEHLSLRQFKKLIEKIKQDRDIK